MIAEPPATSHPTIPIAPIDEIPPSEPSLSLNQVVGNLQLLLAARRHARHADHAYRYNLALARAS